MAVHVRAVPLKMENDKKKVAENYDKIGNVKNKDWTYKITTRMACVVINMVLILYGSLKHA